jgi:hypothetical protein
MGRKVHRGFKSRPLRRNAGEPLVPPRVLPRAEDGLVFPDPGGVAERSNAAVSKTVRGGYVPRGFKSLPLRLDKPKPRCERGFRLAGGHLRPTPRMPLETAQDRWTLALTGAQLAHTQLLRRVGVTPAQARTAG